MEEENIKGTVVKIEVTFDNANLKTVKSEQVVDGNLSILRSEKDSFVCTKQKNAITNQSNECNKCGKTFSRKKV